MPTAIKSINLSFLRIFLFPDFYSLPKVFTCCLLTSYLCICIRFCFPCAQEKTHTFALIYLNLSIAAVISADEGDGLVLLSAHSHSTGALRLRHWDRGPCYVWENNKAHILLMRCKCITALKSIEWAFWKDPPLFFLPFLSGFGDTALHQTTQSYLLLVYYFWPADQKQLLSFGESRWLSAGRAVTSAQVFSSSGQLRNTAEQWRQKLKKPNKILQRDNSFPYSLDVLAPEISSPFSYTGNRSRDTC